MNEQAFIAEVLKALDGLSTEEAQCALETVKNNQRNDRVENAVADIENAIWKAKQAQPKAQTGPGTETCDGACSCTGRDVTIDERQDAIIDEVLSWEEDIIACFLAKLDGEDGGFCTGGTSDWEEYYNRVEKTQQELIAEIGSWSEEDIVKFLDKLTPIIDERQDEIIDEVGSWADYDIENFLAKLDCEPAPNPSSIGIDYRQNELLAEIASWPSEDVASFLSKIEAE